MKLLSRDFNRGEKLLLLVLGLALVALAYYFIIDKPVRTDLASAQAEKEATETELSVLQARIARLEEMERELDSITSNPQASRMGSYNNSKEELAFLNDILGVTANYRVDFSSVSRNGDQIRRNFRLNFTVDSHEAAERLLKQIYASELRCLVNNITYSRTRTYYNEEDRVRYARDYYERVTVDATATFFETMVGGTADADLPASGAAAS